VAWPLPTPDKEPMEEQIKSKKRIADHGEVVTGKREVNAMLELVKQETKRIESRFLEKRRLIETALENSG
jgi:hypothetical protein